MKISKKNLRVSVLCSSIFICSGTFSASYLDANAPIQERVADLLSQMTLAEKIGQMTQVERNSLANDSDITTYHIGSLLSGGGSTPAQNIPVAWADMVDGYQAHAMADRLAIPLIYGIDAVHGHSNVVGATIFPHNIGLGATRNAPLLQEIGHITAKEVYATGIPWDFAPCLCVTRDVRWGRTYESFGEHPEIATMMTSYITGMQYGPNGTGSLSDANTILATAKHWVGDGGTEGGDDQGDAIMSEQELREIHIAPYIDAVNRGVGSMMPSYSSWNGEKMHGNDYLINGVLRQELGFDGFIVSDWQAIDQIPGDYASDVRISVNAGVDMVMVPHDYTTFINTLTNEVALGNVTQARIDEAVSRILTAKFELGLFEQPYADRTNLDQIGSAEHRAVARQAVRESLVLLKNNGVLPLTQNYSNVLVTGKNADDIGNQSGGWTISWQGSSGETTIGTTIGEGIANLMGDADTQVTVADSYKGNLSRAGFDLGIVVIGETPYAEGNGDSSNLFISQSDKRAVNNVCGAMPCVVVLVSGRPMIIRDVIGNADAFVSAWLPGTEGDGVAEVLLGDYNFTGTLPVSWPVDMSQTSMNVGDADYNPLYPYGFGLTY